MKPRKPCLFVSLFLAMVSSGACDSSSSRRPTSVPGRGVRADSGTPPAFAVDGGQPTDAGHLADAGSVAVGSLTLSVLGYLLPDRPSGGTTLVFEIQLSNETQNIVAAAPEHFSISTTSGLIVRATAGSSERPCRADIALGPGASLVCALQSRLPDTSLPAQLDFDDGASNIASASFDAQPSCPADTTWCDPACTNRFSLASCGETCAVCSGRAFCDGTTCRLPEFGDARWVTPSEGIVALYLGPDGGWRAICTPQDGTAGDLSVTCRQLGYSELASARRGTQEIRGGIRVLSCPPRAGSFRDCMGFQSVATCLPALFACR